MPGATPAMPGAQAPASPPAAAPSSTITPRLGHHAMGQALMQRAADMLRIAIPLLRGAEEEEPAVKMLAIAVRALPAAGQGTPMPAQGQAPAMAAPQGVQQ